MLRKVRLKDIWMRDPFLLSVRDVTDLKQAGSGTESDGQGARGLPILKEPKPGAADKSPLEQERAAVEKLGGAYWLFGTTDKAPPNVGPYSEYAASGFDCYCSDDLIEWEGPIPAFRRPDTYWADTQFWAPEVYLYNGRLFMFATMKRTGKSNNRGVAILHSPLGSPAGPFVPLFNGPITPPSWSCLDGTLYVEGSVPYMIFCREWTQIGDGQMCYMELEQDFLSAKKPNVLFSASQAPWSKKFNAGSSSHDANFITDGPFMYKSQASGELIMLWSSIGTNDKYCLGIARSTSGSITGPWVHDAEPLFSNDGGHGMFVRLRYERVSDKGANSPEHSLLVLALHSPNHKVRESAPKLFGVSEVRDEQTGLATFSIFDFV